jgi:hypothetical protein
MTTIRGCFGGDGFGAPPTESQFGKNRSQFETTERVAIIRARLETLARPSEAAVEGETRG